MSNAKRLAGAAAAHLALLGSWRPSSQAGNCDFRRPSSCGSKGTSYLVLDGYGLDIVALSLPTDSHMIGVHRPLDRTVQEMNLPEKSRHRVIFRRVLIHDPPHFSTSLLYSNPPISRMSRLGPERKLSLSTKW